MNETTWNFDPVQSFEHALGGECDHGASLGECVQDCWQHDDHNEMVKVKAQLDLLRKLVDQIDGCSGWGMPSRPGFSTYECMFCGEYHRPEDHNMDCTMVDIVRFFNSQVRR